MIKLILNLRESISTEDLEKELGRRKKLDELNYLKRGFTNLKIIPHLTKFIEKYESFILAITDIKEIERNQEFAYELTHTSMFEGDRRSLYKDIKNKNSWFGSDKIVYHQCRCGNFEILIYLNRKLKSVEVSLSNGYGTEYRPNFIDSVCSDCRY